MPHVNVDPTPPFLEHSYNHHHPKLLLLPPLDLHDKLHSQPNSNNQLSSRYNRQPSTTNQTTTSSNMKAGKLRPLPLQQHCGSKTQETQY